MKPRTKNYLWGSEKWEISALQGDVSMVAGGFLKGNPLDELIEVYMGELVGDAVFERFGQEFPLLVKFIDARERLSVQVHPTDEIAAARHGAFGKTEMWVILSARPTRVNSSRALSSACSRVSFLPPKNEVMNFGSDPPKVSST